MIHETDKTKLGYKLVCALGSKNFNREPQEKNIFCTHSAEGADKFLDSTVTGVITIPLNQSMIVTMRSHMFPHQNQNWKHLFQKKNHSVDIMPESKIITVNAVS